jgi:hypothetical protein
MDRENLAIFKKTGAGEGIRTLDPNLGKIRLYEILLLYQIVILLLKNPNTIRTFSAAFSQKALCSRFPDKCEAAALRPIPVIIGAKSYIHNPTRDWPG